MSPVAVELSSSTVKETKQNDNKPQIIAKAIEMDSISDKIDQVNQYRGLHKTYDQDQSIDTEKKEKTEFRNYQNAMDHVKEFYRKQHENQTVAFNLFAREKFLNQHHAQMTVWQALEKLNELVDESDPDTSLSQIQHLLQTAEAIRRDGKPDWMQLTGLIHDLGKLLCFFGAQGQWDVVGDTFIVGCQPQGTVYPETFENNPDQTDARYNTKYGMYQPHCGLQNVLLSFGHDEYIYEIAKRESTLPQAALDMLRYHSFYPWHREGAYQHLCNEQDQEALANVLAFNPYDLYSKSDAPPDPVTLRSYYEGLIDKYFGGRDRKIQW